MRPKIVIDSAIPYLGGVLEPFAEVVYCSGEAITREVVADAHALVIRTRTRCDSTLLAGSSVELIASATIGFDHIDPQVCTSQGIRIATAQGCNARGVLQWVAAALVYLSQQQGWSPSERTLGIVGVGHIGSLVEEYAQRWGFRVVACDPPREEREQRGFLPLAEVISQADILTFHTPLNDTTYHLLNTELIALLKPSAVVLNSSRGAVVDNLALHRSAHPYLFDVWEGEPHPEPTLLADALVATPHIAGYSEQGKAMASAMAVRTLAKHFGFPLQGWYPPGVSPSQPRAIGWEELCATLPAHYDIAAESARLKASPEAFEQMRNTYHYRKEYF